MSIARHAFRLLVGYGAAVLLASALTIGLCLIWMALTSNDARSALALLPTMLMQGALLTAVTAFPGWLLAVMLAETFSERRMLFFVIAGGATALLAHALLAYSFGARRDLGLLWSTLPVIAASFPGGLAGGWMHWRLAGRQSACWRTAR